MPPRLQPTAPRAATAPAAGGTTLPPPPPPATGLLSPGNVAMIAILLAAEAILLVGLLRRVDSPILAVESRDLSRIEYIDLDTVTVALRPASDSPDAGLLQMRIMASILVTGDKAERAGVRETVRVQSQKCTEEISRVISTMTIEQAIDPGNRDRMKDKVRQALNENVFNREDRVREVVFRYYGP